MQSRALLLRGVTPGDGTDGYGREIGVYWYLFSNLVVWCRHATLPNADFW